MAALVQIGVVEIHIWGATVDKIGMPDQFVFDLDPDEGLDEEDVRKAALEFHEKLDDLELANYVKVSGGKGYHIVVPLKPKADWDAVKGFSHDFAEAMEQAAPDRYTATLSKKARKGKIFIDYLRNGRGSTTVARLFVARQEGRHRVGAGHLGDGRRRRRAGRLLDRRRGAEEAASRRRPVGGFLRQRQAARPQLGPTSAEDEVPANSLYYFLAPCVSLPKAAPLGQERSRVGSSLERGRKPEASHFSPDPSVQRPPEPQQRQPGEHEDEDHQRPDLAGDRRKSAPFSITARMIRRKCVSGKISPSVCAQPGMPR